MERVGTVAIIGVGLIGGSIGLALRARGLASRVIGVGRGEASLAEARRIGAIDEATTEPSRGVAGADVVVVCTPVSRIVADVALAVKSAPADVLVTDAGSTKRRIVAAIEAIEPARLAFVGGHPIAGSERKGPTHARADLFQGRVCALTPTARTPADRLERARGFWSGLGCRLVELDPAAHDEALARTSHLPHAVAAALAASIAPDLLDLAAGAYRDGTRVAGADPALWAGIFRENRGPLLDALADFQGQLDAFNAALMADDEPALQAWYERARSRRSRFETQTD